MVNGSGESQIQLLRGEVDQIHVKLRELLLQRRDVTCEIWKIKTANGLDFHVPKRESEIVQQFLDAPEIQQDPDFALCMDKIMQAILQEFREYLIKKNKNQ
jgi:chorismate mutase